jgi:hypothetical protein
VSPSIEPPPGVQAPTLKMRASIPSLRSVQESLRRITETLAAELANPGTASPSWSESEWLLARAVCAMHGVSPLLAGVLRWERPPGEWVAFLAGQKAHTAARFTRIRQLMSSLDAEARREGIGLVALKGAALHGPALYSPGERPMSDIDLLAQERDLERTARVLGRLGFRRTLVTARHQVFEPPQRHAPARLGEHTANDIKFELHGRIREPLPVDPVDITDSVFPREPHPGLNDYPSSAALMTHLLLHAAGLMTFRSVRLLHLHDISLVAAHMKAGDWSEVLGTSSDARSPAWWAYPVLQLAARYYSCIPLRVLDEAKRCCPRALAHAYKPRTLSDVSYTHPWIYAFPGMDWAGSPGAKLRYALRRIRPDPEEMATRAALLQSEPRNVQSSWARLSQFRRILRWLTSRPERVETASAVRAAFEQR